MEVSTERKERGKMGLQSRGDKHPIQDTPDRINLFVGPGEVISRTSQLPKSQTSNTIVKLGYSSPVNIIVILVRNPAYQIEVTRDHHWVSNSRDFPLQLLLEGIRAGMISRAIDAHKLKEEGGGFVHHRGTEEELPFVDLSNLYNAIMYSKQMSPERLFVGSQDQKNLSPNSRLSSSWREKS
jgi:hypothetical protein